MVAALRTVFVAPDTFKPDWRWYGMMGIIRTLTTVFCAILVTTVLWVALSTWDYGAATGLFGEGGSRLVTTLLLAGLALSSGVLVIYHRRAGGDGEYWTAGELVYALALFVSLFYGVYSFFGWFFYA